MKHMRGHRKASRFQKMSDYDTTCLSESRQHDHPVRRTAPRGARSRTEPGRLPCAPRMARHGASGCQAGSAGTAALFPASRTDVNVGTTPAMSLDVSSTPGGEAGGRGGRREHRRPRPRGRTMTRVFSRGMQDFVKT